MMYRELIVRYQTRINAPTNLTFTKDARSHFFWTSWQLLTHQSLTQSLHM